MQVWLDEHTIHMRRVNAHDMWSRTSSDNIIIVFITCYRTHFSITIIFVIVIIIILIRIQVSPSSG